MKKTILRYWNGQLRGLLGLIVNLIVVGFNIFYEKINSFIHANNLGKKGERVFIQKNVVIRNPGNIFLENDVSIGRNCQISSEFTDSKLLIGTNSKIDKNCLLDYSGSLKIGQNVTISEGVMIETHSHGYNPRNAPEKLPLRIGNNVWIGAHAIILPNVNEIGDNSIIGAGTIVTKSVENNSIIVGNPGKLLKKINYE